MWQDQTGFLHTLSWLPLLLRLSTQQCNSTLAANELLQVKRRQRNVLGA
jgi:hypothetical protein